MLHFMLLILFFIYNCDNITDVTKIETITSDNVTGVFILILMLLIWLH